jgi:hypothetical protein
MLMMKISYEALGPGAPTSGRDVGEQRAVADGHNRLWELEGERAEARAEAGSQYQRARHPREYA